jgi:hypothetical protein
MHWATILEGMGMISTVLQFWTLASPISCTIDRASSKFPFHKEKYSYINYEMKYSKQKKKSLHLLRTKVQSKQYSTTLNYDSHENMTLQ